MVEEEDWEFLEAEVETHWARRARIRECVKAWTWARISRPMMGGS